MSISIKRLELFKILREVGGRDRKQQQSHLLTIIISQLGVPENKEEQLKLVKQKIAFVCAKIWQRWDTVKKEETFFKKYAKWLSCEEVFVYTATESVSEVTRGRREVSFHEASDQTKRRRTHALRKKHSAEELSYSAQMKQREEGNEEAAKIVTEATLTTPTRARKIRRSWRSFQSTSVSEPLNNNKALSLVVECDLSKQQYLTTRAYVNSQNSKILPSYHKILQAKQTCYPSCEYMNISENIAEIKLQALLDLTVEQILKIQDSIMVSALDAIDSTKKLYMIWKWGCDGSSGQALYKQKASDPNFTDSDIFFTGIVPLRLYCKSENTSQEEIIWQNPKTSSPRYCRPVRLQFQKESVQLVKQEKTYVQQQIDNLNPTIAHFRGSEISVNHILKMTMVDGKVCNALTETKSTQTCYICGAGPKLMNNINAIQNRDVDPVSLEFGISPLHARIRFMEWLLHVSYRLDVKKWRCGTLEKHSLETRKHIIQQKFKSELGLLIDVPKAGGSGTSNDGNTARRFFNNSTQSADITGIDRNLIERCRVILTALSSGCDININKYEEYAIETAKLYLKLYSWYYMPVTVHKVLLHGSTLISTAILPIGQMSEEAQEARNKDIKMYREFHTRKVSREATNQDLLYRLLLSSDPLLTSLRPTPKKSEIPYSSDVLELLHLSTSSSEETSTSYVREMETSDAEDE